jgi:hypothetical protein
LLAWMIPEGVLVEYQGSRRGASASSFGSMSTSNGTRDRFENQGGRRAGKDEMFADGTTEVVARTEMQGPEGVQEGIGLKDEASRHRLTSQLTWWMKLVTPNLQSLNPIGQTAQRLSH